MRAGKKPLGCTKLYLSLFTVLFAFAILPTPQASIPFVGQHTERPTQTLTPLHDYEIALNAAKGDNAAIYIVRADGSDARLITDGKAWDTDPAWSPDGQMIAFASDRDGPPGHYQIYVMNADGTNQRRLTNNQFMDFAPAWSPDGHSIAFVSDRDGFWQIYVMQADGTNQRRLTSGSHYSGAPAWSPDGQHIAFDADTGLGNAFGSDIFIMRADGSDIRRITDNQESFHPAWSPDGKYIAFAKGNYYDGYQICVMKIDGTEQRCLTEQGGQQGHPAWSPDGRYLAFEFPTEERIVINLMNADGSGVRSIFPGGSVYPAWRPKVSVKH